EHRYVCSECSHLAASLEDALLHQQHHLGTASQPQPQAQQQQQQHHHYELVGIAGDYQALAVPESSQYQCLECGQLLVTPGQLLEHQELHIKLLGQDLPLLPAAPPHPPAPPLPPPPLLPAPGGKPTLPAGTSGIHYECLECQALFSSQELWLSHRQSHRGTAAAAATTAAVTAEGANANPGQGQGQNQALVDLEHSYRKPGEEEEEEGEEEAAAAGGTAGTGGGTVQLLLYECGECLQLFQTPKDFLEHQAAHLGTPILNGANQASLELQPDPQQLPPAPPPAPPPPATTTAA
ncbi:ZN574 protein, partial [Eubucco bourcierii]|nr:ZN574 protein [Eubucco bourcierii]